MIIYISKYNRNMDNKRLTKPFSLSQNKYYLEMEYWYRLIQTSSWLIHRVHDYEEKRQKQQQTDLPKLKEIYLEMDQPKKVSISRTKTNKGRRDRHSSELRNKGRT